ncbi:GNAT family N-acetyltransferase [Chitinophaga sp. Cy-1792]|uniref:GNAT family N-acetyltransferase n=1 Tax=Chitinophaga sp. Cy-1792 TaxID=2608339 RepID=UPI0014219512|nr:GNAT family N-acetyltransferase [Chitinophaga sp. Cy-1792]NIG52251.1 GNAT family N-acetyltransferase [Chitinophaga sp. Cy-1792]
MLPLQTDRLFVYPCRLPLLTEIYLRHPHATETLEAVIPNEWPPEEIKELLPYFLEMLQHDPKSFPWLVWIIVAAKERKVIGNVGFKGRPDKDGMVEISYYLIPGYRSRGFMSEAAAALIKWTFTESPVRKIVAECDATNVPSLRVLQKLGMRLTHKSGEMLHWQISRPAKI